VGVGIGRKVEVGTEGDEGKVGEGADADRGLDGGLGEGGGGGGARVGWVGGCEGGCVGRGEEDEDGRKKNGGGEREKEGEVHS